MRKFIFTLFLMLITSITAQASSWRESFATRLMKLMTSSPEYTVLAVTDIDCNDVPEAFLIQKGGGIGHGITIADGAVTAITAPDNISGMCLTDITVYDTGAGYVCVGKEADGGVINYYRLALNGNTLLCERVLKSDFSIYPSIAYTDTYSENLHTAGYPDRSKINKFLGVYETPNEFFVKPTDATLSINGNNIHVSGFNIDGSNYYKIRDIAMVLRGTDSKFEVLWNESVGIIEVKTGLTYTALGNELDHKESYRDIKKVSSQIMADGKGLILDGYNIDGSTYFKVRDIGDLTGFETGWDAGNQTILIIT